MEILTPRVAVPLDFSTAKMLNLVEEDPPIDCGPEPVNLTMPVGPGMNAPALALFVQLPAMAIVYELSVTMAELTLYGDPVPLVHINIFWMPYGLSFTERYFPVEAIAYV